MENKYYQPEIEEFYVGFECEWQCKLRNETWNKQVCDVDLINIAYDAIEHADEEEPFEEQFRVKYLDEQDVLDLEFNKQFSTRSKILDTPCDVYISEEKNLMLVYYPSISKVTISTRDYSKNNITRKGTWDDKQINLITIKNKSELKKILKMLDCEVQ